jgi:hypothetical protein
MPTTERLYAKSLTTLSNPEPPSVTPTISVTPSITPTISVTPSITPSITSTPSITPSVTPSITVSVTPSITPSITVSVTPSITITPSVTLTPTPTPSIAYYYLANTYDCYTGPGPIDCGLFTGQATIFSGVNNFTIGNYYTGSGHVIYQPVESTTNIQGAVTINSGTGYSSCALACSSSYN